ncbi:MAG: U32 family peptidase [Bacilli bacterium]|nr:U32 family peptidase [Bacilli bacterium]MBN2877064.1 U32 family peptidase [Bacilli bacterium]
MQFVARLKTASEIETLHQLGVDVFSVDTKLAIHKLMENQSSDIEAIAKIANSLGRKVYLNINKMIHEEDLGSLQVLLEDAKRIGIDSIVINDMTVYVIAKQLGLESKIIYQPGTMNTDSYSVEYFQNHPIKGITLSREITLNEIRKIAGKAHDLELSLIGHGYLDMFYSKRKLLTNYFKHKNIIGREITNKHSYRLNEEIRADDFYPIIEDEFGTHVFRSRKLITFQELETLEPVLSDFFLERLFLEDEEYYDSIRLYKGVITEEEFLGKYSGYESGFYYLPTELIKGDSNVD